MPRLRNTENGVVVNVDDGTASKLVGNWVDADAASTQDGSPKGNASRAEWAAYADTLGVTYDEDAKRDEIKAAITASGDQKEGDHESVD